MMHRKENAPKLVVVFDGDEIVEVTTGLPLAGFNPKFAVETYVPTPFHRAELERERARSAGLVAALDDVVTQVYGLKNSWCGAWFKCGECEKPFAAGGNWTVSYYPESLPFEQHRCELCRARAALSAYGQRREG